MHVKDLIRNGNISTKRDEVAQKTGGSHDYYLRARPPSGAIDVDHTFECQFLAHAIVQAPETHDVLRQISLSSTRTGQPMVVQGLIDPLYEIQNSSEGRCMNLKLLDKDTNIHKGAAGRNFIQGFVDEEFPTFGSCLRDQFVHTTAVEKRMISADALVRKFESELLSIETAYVDAVMDAQVPAAITGAAERRRATARYEGVGEAVKTVYEVMGLNKSR
jgi:hypothetical protein